MTEILKKSEKTFFCLIERDEFLFTLQLRDFITITFQRSCKKVYFAVNNITLTGALEWKKGRFEVRRGGESGKFLRENLN